MDGKLYAVFGNRIMRLCFFSSFVFCLLFLMPQDAAGGPYHRISVDGNLDEWAAGEKIVNDSGDGEVMNKIDGLYVTWDADNLYMGINYKVDGYGILLYLDSDYGGLSGQSDLTQIDTWNKGAKFSADGFKPDFMYGSWDGDDGNFYEIRSSVTASWISAPCATDFSSDVPGTEIAVRWDTLLPSGFPPGTRIAVFAALCDGLSLAIDAAPNNILVSLPDVDTCTIVDCDSDNDGRPDRLSSSDFTISSIRMPKLFSPNSDGLNDSLAITVAISQSADVQIKAYSIEGKKVWQATGRLSEAGELTVTWAGRDFSGDFLKNGIYIVNIRAANASGEEVYENKAVAIIK